jgi:hypothetical protein
VPAQQEQLFQEKLSQVRAMNAIGPRIHATCMDTRRQLQHASATGGPAHGGFVADEASARKLLDAEADAWWQSCTQAAMTDVVTVRLAVQQRQRDEAAARQYEVREQERERRRIVDQEDADFRGMIQQAVRRPAVAAPPRLPRWWSRDAIVLSSTQREVQLRTIASGVQGLSATSTRSELLPLVGRLRFEGRVHCFEWLRRFGITAYEHAPMIFDNLSLFQSRFLRCIHNAGCPAKPLRPCCIVTVDIGEQQPLSISTWVSKCAYLLGIGAAACPRRPNPSARGAAIAPLGPRRHHRVRAEPAAGDAPSRAGITRGAAVCGRALPVEPAAPRARGAAVGGSTDGLRAAPVQQRAPVGQSS